MNLRKTRLATRSQRQRQRLAGVVVNRHANLARADFDRLMATLNICVRFGPASQNREGVADFRAHLAGRLAYAVRVNPVKAARLQRLYEQIDWTLS